MAGCCCCCPRVVLPPTITGPGLAAPPTRPPGIEVKVFLLAIAAFGACASTAFGTGAAAALTAATTPTVLASAAVCGGIGLDGGGGTLFGWVEMLAMAGSVLWLTSGAAWDTVMGVSSFTGLLTGSGPLQAQTGRS